MKGLTGSIVFFTVLFVLSVLLSGCGYRFGYGSLLSNYETISVPFAEGDKDGKLTIEVIRKLSTSGAFRFVAYGGDLIVKIKLLNLNDENIGFRYDQHKSGKLKKTIIPTETRLKANAEVVLIDSTTNRIVRGPVIITANAEFDHDFYSTRNSENVFSLGQLNDIDAARDAAMYPLNRELADKIGDYIVNSK